MFSKINKIVNFIAVRIFAFVVFVLLCMLWQSASGAEITNKEFAYKISNCKEIK